MTTKNRLAQLEKKRTAQITTRHAQIVIYDAATGAPLTPVTPNKVTVWIPDNKR